MARMSDAQRIVVVACLAVLVCACATVVGAKMDADKLASIKPGVTTLGDLEAMFGHPYNMRLGTNGKILATWKYVHQQLSVLIGGNNVVETFTVRDTVNQTKMDADKLASIKPGVTTLGDLEAMFGHPYNMRLGTNGKIAATWNYSPAQSYRFGKDIKQQQLSVLIGPNNVVEKFTVLDTVNQPKHGD